MQFFLATIVEASSNLRISPLRTSLALIGIAIGCGAVVAILQIGFIAERQILKDLEQAGLNLIVAGPSYRLEGDQGGSTPPLPSSEEVEALLKGLPSIRHVALIKEHGQEVHIQGESVYIQILAVTPSIEDVIKLQLQGGSFNALAMGAAPIGIVGADVVSSLTRPIKLAVGDHIRLGFDGYEVGGLLAPTDYNGMIGLDLGRSLLIPEQSIKRLTQEIQNWRLIIEAAPNAVKTEIEDKVKEIFRHDYGMEIEVQHAETIIAARQSQQRSLTLLLTALGGVALIVGTVGVANVMLAAVAERRKEIGLRMAIGAGPGDIKLLFLIEAILLCCFGGLFGTIVGIIGSNFYARVSITDFTISYGVLAAALIVSTLTGLISGYYPARQSSLLDPVEALQSD